MATTTLLERKSISVSDFRCAAGPGDKVFESQGIKIYLDPKSALFVSGTEIDFQESIMGAGFVADTGDVNFLWELYNRNKRGIALDLRVPEGRTGFGHGYGLVTVLLRPKSRGEVLLTSPTHARHGVGLAFESPARERRMALEIATIASFWPTTLFATISSMFSSLAASSSIKRVTGIPVQRETTLAMSSSDTSSFKIGWFFWIFISSSNSSLRLLSYNFCSYRFLL